MFFLDPPDYLHSQIVCQELLAVPTSQSKMILQPGSSNPMCQGGTATYTCNAGGVNVFKVHWNLVIINVTQPGANPTKLCFSS